MARFELARLPEPDLEFGGSAYFRDPRRGLLDAGPFDLRFGSAHRSQIRLAVVGSSEMVDLALAWFARCMKPIPSTQPEDSRQSPPYEGFQAIFRSELVADPTAAIRLDQTKLNDIVGKSPYDAFDEALKLYAQAILDAKRDFRPDVVVCAIPDALAKRVWLVERRMTLEERRVQKQIEQAAADDQMQLPLDWEPEEVSEDLLKRDFRRALKAVAMSFDIPIQIVRQNALLDLRGNEEPAIRAWNLGTGIYYKAGGIPWRVAARGPETCFAGITFHHLRTNKRDIVFSSLAQAYSSNGEGFTLRGSSLLPDDRKRRIPHMTMDQARDLAGKVLAEYKRRNGAAPKQMVLHKSSRFSQAEHDGVMAALAEVPLVRLVAIAPTPVRLVTHSMYPPARGTVLTIEGTRHFLFTSGFVPELGTYPGPHVPAPVELVFQDQPSRSYLFQAATEILGLGRLNWNTSDLRSSQPVTLGFARRVGGIMAEYGVMSSRDPDPNYRYYM